MRASREFELPALLAAIVESANDSIVSSTLDGVITSWNAAAERMYGYTAAEIIGRSASLLIPPETAPALMPVLRRVRQGARIDHFETRLRRKDGSLIEVSRTDSPLRDASGAVVGTSSITRDMTELNRDHARFRGLLEAAPDAMVCADSGGRIVLVNAQAERLFGYPREELSGRRRDGTTFPAEIALSALDTDQGLLVSAAVRDATQQRQARDELSRINQNLTSFSYSLAHDLRTPLRALAGYSMVLIEEYADILGEDGRGYAQRIEAASEQMGHILDDLLHLSRIARATISLQHIDLGAEAAAIAAALQREDPDRRACFTIQQPAPALADLLLIREVLCNLLGNAWKFTSGRDTASIEFGMTPGTDGRVRCYVRDNGAGFDPAYAHKLFQPFQRLHTAREFPGTGIGLASVRQIADRHHGRTWGRGDRGRRRHLLLHPPGRRTGRATG